MRVGAPTQIFAGAAADASQICSTLSWTIYQSEDPSRLIDRLEA